MTRNEFIKRLKAGLKGMPQDDIDDIVADYQEHFEAGIAEGRSEEEVAAALGNPARLARELRFEAGFQNWHSDRSPASAWSAILAFMGLATIDILILLPIVLPVIGVVFGLFVAVIACFFAGGFVLIAGPFSGFPGGWLVAILAGLGIMSASVAAGALLTLVSIWIVNALMWFGRLHYRVIEPAINSDN
jgi:Predicted membrane protein